MKSTKLSFYITDYLGTHLPVHRNVSHNTISSYCDTFRLFLCYCRDNHKIQPEKFSLSEFNRDIVIGFLDWLESERKSSISTRNQRQAALQSFSRYMMMELPQLMDQYQQILCIPIKKKSQPTVKYLTPDDTRLFLSLADNYTKAGRRDMALLSLLYDSGARVQELADLTVRDVRLDAPPHILLTGKGRKSRSIPLLPQTAGTLKSYMAENNLLLPEKYLYPLFPNRHGNKLTRSGISYIVEKYSKIAIDESASIPEKITPHMLRHTKAMHLLQAGVHLIYIRDILGHVDVSTTGIYAKADMEMKRKALEKVNCITPEAQGSWAKDTELRSCPQLRGT